MNLHPVLIFIALFSANSFASERMTTDWIVNLVESRGLSTVEEVLSRLPAELLGNYSLVHTSRNQAQFASLETPRVILFSNDGGFQMTFTADSTVRGGSSIEVSSQRPDGRYEYTSIDFSQKSPVRRNPPSCMGCHGQIPRPIWDPYPYWASSYGSDHDVLKDPKIGSPGLTEAEFNAQTDEIPALRRLQKRSSSLPRLAFLNQFETVTYTQLANLNMHLSGTLTQGSLREWVAEFRRRPRFPAYFKFLKQEFGERSYSYTLREDAGPISSVEETLPSWQYNRIEETFKRKNPIRASEITTFYWDLERRMQTMRPSFRADHTRRVLMFDVQAFSLLESIGYHMGMDPVFFTSGKQGLPRIGGTGYSPGFYDFWLELQFQLKNDPANRGLVFKSVKNKYPLSETPLSWFKNCVRLLFK